MPIIIIADASVKLTVIFPTFIYWSVIVYIKYSYQTYICLCIWELWLWKVSLPFAVYSLHALRHVVTCRLLLTAYAHYFKLVRIKWIVKQLCEANNNIDEQININDNGRVMLCGELKIRYRIAPASKNRSEVDRWCLIIHWLWLSWRVFSLAYTSLRLSYRYAVVIL